MEQVHDAILRTLGTQQMVMRVMEISKSPYRWYVPYIDDELWAQIVPLLPKQRERPGPSPIPDRDALNGIVFVLKHGVGWNQLPTRLGFGSGVTCWRRLRYWQDAGVWDAMYKVLRVKLHETGRTDITRALGGQR
ncbi:hypothetical protein C7H84_36055 [Burkholderia sp. Nafp2/4-1b]|uniref:transposase n=1 Tax=Burkholderia sp. Nafp2/4-1b TaxID=2116686 RepID=UPI000EF90DD1|nr:transposase [Burkholderia sp. Nafp2/4-1b]RKT98632.1 hypothetical protein C7H84_36055 [Burkholderia sp. Nafp2/4-1b]